MKECFPQSPRKQSPLWKQEITQSDFCNEEEIKQYQTLISQLQWLISLGRFDIVVHTMSLSRYRAQPQKGHSDRVKRIFGYLAYLPEGAIRFRTGEPDFSDIQDQKFDWSRTVYGSLQETIPTDIPEPRGKYVTTVLYVDANLHYDLVTGRAVTAILHIVNSTPTDWYSKRQTVETATYGSEFVAARIAVDQIVDLWYTLMYLGVPIRSKSFMFGDNKSVIMSSTIPNSLLSKRHHISACHRVREAIALKYLMFIWKDAKTNPADILSKHWEFPQICPLLKLLLFWRGAAAEIKQQPKGSDTNPTDCRSSKPQGNQKDSRLATASSK